MAINVKENKAKPKGAKPMFIRGVTERNQNFLRDEAMRLGYEHLGEYINALVRAIRQEQIDEGRNPVRKKTG